MRRSFVLALLCFASWALPAEYTFTPLPETGNAHVRVRLAGNAQEFWLPEWAPGDYQIFSYGKFVESIWFKKAGLDVPSVKDPILGKWTLPQGADTVEYIIKPSRGNFSPNLRVTATDAFVSGPGVFGWFVGNDMQRQTLRIKLMPEGATAHTTLRPETSSSEYAVFSAPNFDEMIDAPFVVGTGIRTQNFEVAGVPHGAVLYGGEADLISFQRVGRKSAEQSLALFGELPMPRYIFFVDRGRGGGGGLEHSNSARLGMWTGDAGEAVEFIFHEYFHAFNVKRIRERPLGPFDYTKPAMVSTLWWLEGVTDYYATILAHRAGLQTREEMLRDFSGSYASLLRNPNRLRVSAEESSLRVWEARGSQGFGGLNYYQKGRLIGLILDLAIRDATDGKRSLDDAMRILYAECKGGKPGYTPERLKEIIVQVGGPSLDELYEVCVRQAVEMPMQEVLAMFGIVMDGANWIESQDATERAMALRAAWPSPTNPPALKRAA